MPQEHRPPNFRTAVTAHCFSSKGPSRWQLSSPNASWGSSKIRTVRDFKTCARSSRNEVHNKLCLNFLTAFDCARGAMPRTEASYILYSVNGRSYFDQNDLYNRPSPIREAFSGDDSCRGSGRRSLSATICYVIYNQLRDSENDK